MIEYILNYIEDKGQPIMNAAEQKAVENGIRLYLEENGIAAGGKKNYYRRFADAHLALIDADDLKTYFAEYDSISRVKQIAIEQAQDGRVSHMRVRELYGLMIRLNEVGLGSKYIPAVEVNAILGRYA